MKDFFYLILWNQYVFFFNLDFKPYNKVFFFIKKYICLPIFRFLSMDPVQNDLKLLGVKPLEPDDYNIHTPPLPKGGNTQARVDKSRGASFCYKE